MNSICQELKNIIEKSKFVDAEIRKDDEEECIIDFRHPLIEPEKPVAYFLSSVVYRKPANTLETTIRGKIVGTLKELYLEPCCEDGINVCRPHINVEDKIISVHAVFKKNPVERFKKILNEMI